MNQETTDKIRQIIRDQYGCDDIFTPNSPLTGSMLLGDSIDAMFLSIRIRKIGIDTGNDFTGWQTVQDVFDSVEQAIFNDSDPDVGN